MFDPTPLPSVCIHRRQQALRERNFTSAFLCFVFVIIMASALAQPHWFYLRGGTCSQRFMGIQEYYFIGKTDPVTPRTETKKGVSMIYNSFHQKSKECLTPQIMTVHKTIIFLCFACIFCSSAQLIMDVIGVRNKKLKCLRRNAVGVVFSAILTIVIVGLCFYSTELIKAHQEKNKVTSTTSVQVDFSTSYYLVIVASVVSIFAASANLLRRYPEDHFANGHILLGDCPGQETFSVASPHSRTWARILPPNPTSMPEVPPPYTP